MSDEAQKEGATKVEATPAAEPDKNQAEAACTTAAHTAEDEHTIYHITPPSVYFGTFGALMVLTALTVGAAQIDFGALNIWIALLIAGTKASLVGLFFMHLKYTNRFNSIVFLGGLIFLAIFLAFTMMDTETRHWYPEATQISAPGMPYARQ